MPPLTPRTASLTPSRHCAPVSKLRPRPHSPLAAPRPPRLTAAAASHRRQHGTARAAPPEAAASASSSGDTVDAGDDGGDAAARRDYELDDDALIEMMAADDLTDEAAAQLKSEVRERNAAKRREIEDRHGPGIAVDLAQRMDVFNLWLWFEYDRAPTPDDIELLDGVLTAWFLLGRLGGFNSLNLQLSRPGARPDDGSYDAAELESASMAVMHDFGDVETQGRWARVRVNMGTADELALDVLANALSTLARENTPALTRWCVGGEPVPDWPPPKPDFKLGPDGGEGPENDPMARDY